MRRLMTALFVTLVALFAATTASGAAGEAHAACTRARIGPRIECLAPGRRCRPHYEQAYRQYGYTCRRAHDGHHRLAQHRFSAPPNPAPMKKTG